MKIFLKEQDLVVDAVLPIRAVMAARAFDIIVIDLFIL
jgi:hypothetical protein